MNTKGIKFLAVLAVLAMAFAAFAVIAPTEENDAAKTSTKIVTEDVNAAGLTGVEIAVKENVTITLDADLADDTNFYILSGKTVRFVVSTAQTNNIVVDSATAIADPGANNVTEVGKTITISGAAVGTSFTVTGGATKTIITDMRGTVAGIVSASTDASVLVTGALATTVAIEDTALQMTVSAEGTLTLGGNYAMLNGGSLTVEGTLAASAASTISGAATSYFKIAPSASVDMTNLTITIDANMIGMDAATGDYEIKGTLQANTTVTAATLASDLIIPEGLTLTVNGMLAMDVYTITVEGTLEIGSAGYIGSNSAGTATIAIASTGEIVNNGTIGKNFPVKIMDAVTTDSFITLRGVSGVNIDKVGIGTPAVQYLAISGMVMKQEIALSSLENIKANHILTASKTYVDGELTLTDGTFLDSAAAAPLYVMKDSLLTVNSGATLGITTGTSGIEMMNGSSVIVNGYLIGKITAQTENSIAAADVNAPVDGKTVFAATVTAGPSDVNHKSISGLVVVVDRVQYTELAAVKYTQRAYISGALTMTTGTPSGAADEDTTAVGISVTCGGDDVPAFVAEDDILTFGKNTGINLAAGYMLVQGTVLGTDPSAIKDKISGASFQITEGTTPVDYITGFDAALESIDFAVSKIVKFYGYKGTAANVPNGDAFFFVTGTLDIENGQTIALGSTAPASMVKIASTGIVTVQKGGNLDKNVINEIAGQLIVMNGGACTPTSGMYEVVSTDADGDKKYASLATVLKDAQAGDEITLASNAGDLDTVITINDGITLKVAKQLSVNSLTVNEGGVVTVTSAGELVTLKSTKDVAPKITVSGTLDVSAGAFTTNNDAGKKTTVTSTGKFIYTAAEKAAAVGTNGSKFVGAEYTDAKTGNLVLTTAEAAIDSDALIININENYTSTEDVILSEGQTLNIADGKKVSIKSIDVTGATVVANGELTATIIGATGVDGADEVEITVAAFKGQIQNDNYINAQAETVYRVKTADAITEGTISIDKGEFIVLHGIQGKAAASQTFTLGADATLVIGANPNFANYSKVTIDGNVVNVTDDVSGITSEVPVVINGDVAVKGAVIFNDTLTINGTLTVAAGSQANAGMTLNGALKVPTGAAITVAGAAIIGAPALGADLEITGKITLADAAYAVAYESISSNFADTVKETKLVINGIEYAYAYSNNAGISDIEDLITNKAVKLEIPGYNTSTIRTITGEFTAWKDAEGELIDKDTTLHAIAVMSYTAAVSQVNIKVSWATGTSIYIDGIRMVDTEYTLDVGKHTVTFNTNPGYKGTDMKVTYKGAAVTDSFTVAVGDDNAILAGVGTISVDPGESPEPTPAEKEAFGITEILLVVLVILIAVMVIIVLLRMNRS